MRFLPVIVVILVCTFNCGRLGPTIPDGWTPFPKKDSGTSVEAQPPDQFAKEKESVTEKGVVIEGFAEEISAPEKVDENLLDAQRPEKVKESVTEIDKPTETTSETPQPETTIEKEADPPEKPAPTLVFTVKQVGPVFLSKGSTGASISLMTVLATGKSFFIKRLTWVNDLSGKFGDNVVSTHSNIRSLNFVCPNKDGAQAGASGVPTAGKWKIDTQCFAPDGQQIIIGLEVSMGSSVKAGSLRFGIQELSTTKSEFFAISEDSKTELTQPTVVGSVNIKPHTIKP